MNKTFIPKLFTVFRQGYSKKQFYSDSLSGLIVGIVALPLAIAFAIASGVSPEKGIITAIIGGFIISAFGGSRVQIGGPTGAFIVIVYSIVQKYGVDGLTLATLMAGIMIIIMGFLKFGSLIKYIPFPLIVGFTSGIALIIFSSQIKDMLGLQMENVPSDFLVKWVEYFKHIDSFNLIAVFISIFTILVSLLFKKITHRIPGSLIAILLSTLIVQVFNLPVETIETKFGSIAGEISFPGMPKLSLNEIKELLQPAFTIAILGAIESLLSAVVADGMIGKTHRSNIELVAQGAANVFSSVFGGIPATGAIARTATNIRNGGRTPVAGIIHALTLLIILLFAGKWAKLIPLSCLAGILVVVAYNMSEWRSFRTILSGPRQDSVILVITFLLTVLVDLTVAIQIGMVLSAFLFMNRMSKISGITNIKQQFEEEDTATNDPDATLKLIVPKGVKVYEINGPFFFGVAHKFKETIKDIDEYPKVLVIRMRMVPIIDATGLHNLKEMIRGLRESGTKIVLSAVQPEVYKELEKARIVFMIGKKNIAPNVREALQRAEEIISGKPGTDQE